MSAGSWIIGIGASAGLHAAVALVVPVLWAPQPVDPQPRPETRMQIETQEVARSETTAVEPEGDPARQSEASGAALSQESIPQSRASASTLPADSAAASAPEGTAVAALPPEGSRLDAAAPATETLDSALPAPEALTASLPPPETLTAAAPATEAVAASLPTEAAIIASTPPPARIAPARIAAQTVTAALAPAPTLTAAVAPAPTITATLAPVSEQIALAAPPETVTATAVAPDAESLSAALPPSTAAAAIIAPALTAPALTDTAERAAPAKAPTETAAQLAAPVTSAPDQTATAAQPVASSTPEAERFTAALAWSSGGETQLDSQALAAIQSFMQPGDLSTQTGEVRDALTALLASVPCSRLQAEFNPDTGSIDLRGHVPEDGLRGPILAALQAQVGSIPVNDAMLILPRPQCGALSGISGVGLPQSTDQLTDSRIIGADAHARAYDYVAGDRLIFDMAAPDYDAYIYVDFFDAAGQVIHLIPNDTVPLTLHPMQSTMRVGISENGEPALEVTIGPPYGQEIAAAFAASAPLYDGLRPIIEPADEYLAWLGERVAEARAADPDFKGEWVYFFVSTSED